MFFFKSFSQLILLDSKVQNLSIGLLSQKDVDSNSDSCFLPTGPSGHVTWAQRLHFLSKIIWKCPAHGVIPGMEDEPYKRLSTWETFNILQYSNYWTKKYLKILFGNETWAINRYFSLGDKNIRKCSLKPAIFVE